MTDISAIYSAFRKGAFTPKNARQSTLISAWEAFLNEHPTDYEGMVKDIPDALNELWAQSEKE